jgi:anti-anti-sigma factor
MDSENDHERKHMEKSSPIATVTEAVILVTREGEWLPSEELRALALSAVDTDGNLTVNLEGVEHLDASALQMLLALAVERKKRGKGLRLANASLALSRWFEYAGGGHISLLNMSVNGHA